MTDFDAIFDSYEANDFVYSVCEIPKGSTLKVEFDRDRKIFMLDRVEPAIFAKPVNYGFIPATTDEDGDPLDTLIVSDEPIPSGVALKTRVIGMLDFVDDGENDHKIVVVPYDDRQSANSIKSLEDLPAGWKAQIAHHFLHYKDLKKMNTTDPRGWGDAAAAWDVIADCATRYQSEI
jgi:inorganic pyrophosphatase